MAGRVRALAFGATLTLIGGCATAPAQKEAVEASEPAPVTAEASAFVVPWPDAADCRALAAAVLAMADSDRQHLRPEDAPLALAIADGPLLLTPEEAAGVIDLDLPIPVAEKTGNGRCLIAASRPRVAPGGGRRLVGHELVRSEYRTRTRRSVNPEYAKLREEAEEEDGGSSRGRVMATGEPSLDLIGLVGGAVIRGIDRLRLGRAKASEQLAKTDRYLETPVYEPYTYDINAFEVGRVGALEVTLLDRAAGRAFEARHTMRERHTFAVAEGRHRSDRGVLEGGSPGAVLPEDVAVFETAAPRPRLSDLLQILAQTTGEGRPADVEAVLASLTALPAAGVTPVAHGRQRTKIETMDSPAEGTWIDAEHVVVPSASVGRSGLVQVTGPDGMRTFGMVEKVDHAKGEAVVRVGRSGSGGRLSDEALEAVRDDLKNP